MCRHTYCIYDADGNMTYGPLNGVMTEFIYDCRNRLIQAGNTTYEYDAENTRIAIRTKEKREAYVVDKNTTYSQVLSITTYEKNLIGQFTRETDYTIYTYGIGLISQESGKKGEEQSQESSTGTTGNTEYYLYHFNQVGSTTQITDEAGNVIYTYAYSAYGERMGTYDGEGHTARYLRMYMKCSKVLNIIRLMIHVFQCFKIDLMNYQIMKRRL